MKRSPLRIILFVSFVDLIGFGLIIPLQAVYADRMNASGKTLGLLIGVYALMQFIFNPLLGRWSDRIGRRPILLASIGGSVLSHVLLGIGDLSQSLTVLFLARILDGVTGANIATAQAYIADVTTGEDRARGMGLFGAAFGVGFMLGPAFGAVLAFFGHKVSGAYGTSWPAFGAAAASLAAFIMVARWLPESVDTRAPKIKTKTKAKTEAEADTATKVDTETATGAKTATKAGLAYGLSELGVVARRPRLVELLVILGVSTFAFVFLEATFVLLCRRRFSLNEGGVGLIFAYIGLIMVIVQGGLIGRLVKRHGEPTMMMIGPYLTAAGFVILSMLLVIQGDALAWGALLGGCLAIGVGRGFANPTVMGLISRQAQESRQGVTLGVSQGLSSLARAISPVIAGLCYDWRPESPYWLGAALFAAVGVYSLIVRPAQQAALAT